VTAPAKPPMPQSHAVPSPIAGSVLPIKRAEELLASLPGVIAARIVASDSGSVDEIHLLTTAEVTPKQTVRNVESALIAHLGMRVDHRKISVAQTVETPRPKPQPKESPKTEAEPREARETREAKPAAVTRDPRETREVAGGAVREPQTAPARSAAAAANGRLAAEGPGNARRLYFEDVEVRRSRTRGVSCCVTLRKGDESFRGEAEGMENERSRMELAARATVAAIAQAEGGERVLALDGAKQIDAFEREFVFVGVTARIGRDSALLTGSCEIKDSPETASVLAVLDATNRWMDYTR